jgi:hypothetical protein
MEGTTSLSQLLQFVRSHDSATDARIVDGAIYATAYSVDLHGQLFGEWDQVGRTLRECRLWLGY